MLADDLSHLTPNNAKYTILVVLSNYLCYVLEDGIYS